MNKGLPSLNEQVLECVIMPIEFQIKKIFELPNVLTNTLQFMHKLESSKNTSVKKFPQGSLWQSKRKLFTGKIIIPYFLYFDDLEVNDSIGAHTGTQTLASFYYNFPTTPLDQLSKLDNIYSAIFLKTAHFKKLCPNKSACKYIEII